MFGIFALESLIDQQTLEGKALYYCVIDLTQSFEA